MKEKSPQQILKIDGKNVFFEAMNSSFNIGKVRLNFIEYDPNNGNHQTKNIPIYIDMDKFLVLANDVTSGRIMKLKLDELKATEARKTEATNLGKETKYIYCKDIWADMGGISSASLAYKVTANEKKNPGKSLFNFEIPAGKCLSRQFKITPGEKMPWILTAEQGIGDDNNETKLIKPSYGPGETMYKPKELVRVPLSDEDFKRFVIVVASHIKAYFAGVYAFNLWKDEDDKRAESRKQEAEKERAILAEAVAKKVLEEADKQKKERMQKAS